MVRILRLIAIALLTATSQLLPNNFFGCEDLHDLITNNSLVSNLPNILPESLKNRFVANAQSPEVIGFVHEAENAKDASANSSAQIINAKPFFKRILLPQNKKYTYEQMRYHYFKDTRSKQADMMRAPNVDLPAHLQDQINKLDAQIAQIINDEPRITSYTHYAHDKQTAKHHSHRPLSEQSHEIDALQTQKRKIMQDWIAQQL